jgi:hypothetical protein
MTKPKPAPTNKTSELKIGPFSGGINRYSDASAIADTELVDCVNFDVDLDGSLKSRPPVAGLYNSPNNTYSSGTFLEASTQVLGTFVGNAGDKIVLFQYIERLQSPDSDKLDLVIYFMDGPNANTAQNIASITGSSNPFTSMTRYKNILYLTRSYGGGAKFDIATLTYTDLPGMPWGSKGIIYKERFWLVGDQGSNYSRMVFSDIGDPETFQPASFFDIRPGDGESLNDIILYQDNLILFKNSSIWVFAYDTQPQQAVLQQLHDDLGVENRWSLVLYENVIYFLKYNQVYQISNFNFTRISTKLPFEDDKTLPTATGGENWSTNSWKFPNWMSLVGDRLVVRFYNRLYVYHLRTRAWTRWESKDNNVQYVGQYVRVETAGSVTRQGYDTYVAGSSLLKPPYTGVTNKCIPTTMQLKDTYDGTSVEGVNYLGGPVNTTNIFLNIKTKIYDIGISHRFKRLLHWGCDIVTGQNVTGTLNPVSLAYRVTWGQLHEYKWNQLQTWGYPLFAQPSITQTAVSDTGVYRRFIRFPRSLRFRLLQFELSLQTVGNTKDGPARLYSLTAFMRQRQLVPKGVN